MMFLSLAFVFAGVNKSYGQCEEGPLNPTPGVEYDYSVEIGTGTGYDGDGEFLWYITKSTDLLMGIIDEGTLFNANAATPYNTTTDAGSTISLTWTSAAITDGGPFYLVLKYTEANANADPTCSAENLKAWEIKPVNTFLLALDPASLGATNYEIDADANDCAAPITSATVNTGNDPIDVTIIYGQNELYFIATASGIQGTWRPHIQIPALNPTQAYVSADWTADMTGSGGWVSFGAAADGTSQNLVSASDATVTDATNGTPILIRIVLANNQWQTLADQSIGIALDGFLDHDDNTISDIIGGEGADACDLLDPWERTATYTILARPTIVPDTPAPLGLTNP